MPVPQEIFGLVGRFENNREAYRSGAYNETQLRREFVDPFFKLLGWDVNNEKGYAEAYKDVIHEDSIKVGGVTKAPDYCFRIGGTRKFFVETKKPSVNLKDDISPAFQLRRYAWSAKLPLSILTDFEEFAVYDCRVKPDKSDKSSTARILYLNCNEYAQRWDEIFEIFSRDAVLKGSFDRYAESSKVKKGTASVDDAFLKEIESWRDMIARSLALRNADLNQHDLNFAVQRTIDRIVFLRICEDRGIEQYGRLMALQNGDRAYARLCEMFQRADERYNSGLFHFQKDKSRAESPDTLTLNLAIDDSVLKNIIKNLYYPDSPYEFSVLSADILGQVYEQFLGKVIRLTAGHRAVVEEKPEVRKAGGVYYTPTYIVDYIVKNTVGKLVRAENFQPLRKTTPKEISKIRILDPACGSGSFLLGAYQYLLDWHRDWYVANDPEKWATGRSPALYQIADSNPQSLAGSGLQPEPNISVQSGTIEPAEKSPPGRGLRGGSQTPKLVLDSDRGSKIGNWHLTTAERKRILLNNIYGVDIDPQAVEVTKLSLLLKVLEGESEQTLARQLKLFHERALPDLGNNIKCGNSLIGTDFYHTPQTPFFRGEKMDSPLARGAGGVSDEERRKVNPFDWEAEFPEIMQSGGFDAVIGNPPYGVPFSTVEINYFQKHFSQSQNFPDSYCLFIEKALQLLRNDGMLSFIVPNTFCDLENCDAFRHWLLTENNLIEIWQTGWAFRSAIVDTIVFFMTKTSPISTAKVSIDINGKKYKRTMAGFVRNELCKIDYRNTEEDKKLINDVFKSSINLSKIAIVKAGVKMYEKGKGTPPQLESVIKQRPFSIKGNCPQGWEPLYRGEYVNRYYLSETKEFVNYGPWLAAPRNPELFNSPKILMRRTDDRLRSCLEEESSICVNSCHIIKLNESFSDGLSYSYLLGILNSRLMQKLFELQNPQMVGKVFAEIKVVYVERLPIHPINSSDLTDKARYDQMVALVDQMLELHKQLASAKTDHDKTAIQRQIDATDRQIDQLVYELYGLTKEEIKIVEEGSP